MRKIYLLLMLSCFSYVSVNAQILRADELEQYEAVFLF